MITNHHARVLGTMLIALLAIAGCEPEPAPDPEVQDIAIDLGGLSELDFGPGVQGDVRERSFEVINLRSEPTPVTVRQEGSDAFVVTAPPGLGVQQFVLEPQARQQINVRYVAHLLGEDIGGVFFRTSLPGTRERVVRMSAATVGPSLTFEPWSLDLGTVEVGCALKAEVTLHNHERTVAAVSLVESSSSLGPLGLDYDLETGDSIPSGFRWDFTITALPTEPSDIQGALTVRTEDGEDSILRISASVEAPATLHTQVFQQADLYAIDVLVVYDNVWSMGDHWDRLEPGFRTLAESLVNSGLDARLAVLPLDAVYEGRPLWGDPSFVSTMSASAVDSFLANVDVPREPIERSRGLDAALHTVDPLADVDATVLAFRRPDAMLHVVFVSNREDVSWGDQIPNTPPVPLLTADKFVQWATRWDPRVGQAVFHSVTGGWSGCTVDELVVQGGARYAATAAESGGIEASICDSDWAEPFTSLEWVSDIAARSVRLTQSIYAPQDIEVFVSGFPIAADAWTFDPEENAVVLEPGVAPPAAGNIMVRYPGAACPFPRSPTEEP